MPAYWIARVDVANPERYAAYARDATEAIAAHGGRFLARGGRSVALEGSMRARNVLVEFPDVAAAEACYAGAAYRAALAHATGASEREIVMVEGL